MSQPRRYVGSATWSDTRRPRPGIDDVLYTVSRRYPPDFPATGTSTYYRALQGVAPSRASTHGIISGGDGSNSGRRASWNTSYDSVPLQASRVRVVGSGREAGDPRLRSHYSTGNSGRAPARLSAGGDDTMRPITDTFRTVVTLAADDCDRPEARRQNGYQHSQPGPGSGQYIPGKPAGRHSERVDTEQRRIDPRRDLSPRNHNRWSQENGRSYPSLSPKHHASRDDTGREGVGGDGGGEGDANGQVRVTPAGRDVDMMTSRIVEFDDPEEEEEHTYTNLPDRDGHSPLRDYHHYQKLPPEVVTINGHGRGPDTRDNVGVTGNGILHSRDNHHHGNGVNGFAARRGEQHVHFSPSNGYGGVTTVIPSPPAFSSEASDSVDGYSDTSSLQSDSSALFPGEHFHVDQQANLQHCTDDCYCGEGGRDRVAGDDTDSPFAGRRDLLHPVVLNETKIVSAKGTVRGYRNRVKAGIATFLENRQGTKVSMASPKTTTLLYPSVTLQVNSVHMPFPPNPLQHYITHFICIDLCITIIKSGLCRCHPVLSSAFLRP